MSGRNPDLEKLQNYTAAVVRIKGKSVQFIKAICSGFYIYPGFNKKPRSSRNPTSLEIYFSKPCDLVEQDGRKGSMRVYLGLIQSLHDLSKLYNI